MNQGPEQLLQISNRHHVGPIRWRVVGVFMRLDEHRRTTDCNGGAGRSEEHTSELQSLMRISYAVFCLKNKNKHTHTISTKTYNTRTKNSIMSDNTELPNSK